MPKREDVQSGILGFDAPFTSGRHPQRFDGGRLSSGLYFARLETAQQRVTHKLALLK